VGYIDSGLRYQFLNRALQEHLGPAAESADRRALARAGADTLDAAWRAPLEASLSRGCPLQCECTCPRSGRIYACLFLPDLTASQSPRGAFVLGIDITEQRTIEDQRKRERLEQTWLSLAEHEQERLGQELHDSVGQELSGASFLAKALAVRLQTEGSALAEDADWVKQLLARCVEHIRALSRQLSPTELENGTVLAAIDRLCTDVERSYGVSCTLIASARSRPLCAAMSPVAARQLYRVCQEALNNAMRHGDSKHIRVRVDLRGRHLRLAILDDGRGFDSGSTRGWRERTEGIGLHSMLLRANSLDGHLRIGRHSACTLVLLRAPFGRLMFAPSDPHPASPLSDGRPHAHPAG
jgi:signal transduction histidine kinase